jgi:hypothetical protein
MLVVVLIFVGVVLPAVWSRRPERRCAAAGVLGMLMDGTVELVTVLRFRKPGL